MVCVFPVPGCATCYTETHQGLTCRAATAEGKPVPSPCIFMLYSRLTRGSLFRLLLRGKAAGG